MYLASTLKSNRELLEKIRDEEEEFRNRKIQLEKDIELGEIQQKIMEQSGTIVKLKTQILKLSENIEGKLLPNNYEVVATQYNKDYSEYCNMVRIQHPGGAPANITKKVLELRAKMDNAQKESPNKCNSNNIKISLKEFVNNINELDKDTKNLFQRKVKLVTIPPQIKIYDDIIPIFDTIFSVLKKQQEQLDKITK
tara:strand:+ start:1095 stop:1682 length:588 start_codon:yes stop_codon:yes gene_type:complete